MPLEVVRAFHSKLIASNLLATRFDDVLNALTAGIGDIEPCKR
jgi:hypothetical protein